MAEGETKLLMMIESLLDRKLGFIVDKSNQVAEHFSELRVEIAALKQEIITTSASLAEIKSLLPGSHPSTQNSGTTLSSGHELRAQPIPDGDEAAYSNPTRPCDGAFGYDDDYLVHLGERDDWMNRDENQERSPSLPQSSTFPVMPVGIGPLQACAGSALFAQQPETSFASLSAAMPGLMPIPLHQSGPQGFQPAHGSSSVLPWLMSDLQHQSGPPGFQPAHVSSSALPWLMPNPQHQSGPPGCQPAHESSSAQPWLMLNPQYPSCPPSLQPAHDSSSACQPPAASPMLPGPRSLHRKHNPKSCMICRGTFIKLSSCKDHMLKCLKPNSGCRLLTNCDHHQRLIRPFTGPNIATRWHTAISEWIHRKE